MAESLANISPWEPDPEQSSMDTGPVELTILMPCLNEAETLEVCITKAHNWLRENKVEGEVLIADNGSTDGSQDIIRRLGARLIHVKKKGYGSALMGGIDAARGKYIIMGDADDSYDFTNLGPFVEKLREGYDLVMGNRFKGGIAPGAMPPLHKYLGNPVLTWIGKLFYRCPSSDFHCGLRGFSKDAALRMNLRTPGMEFASEMVVKSTLLGMKIAEVPTTLSPDGRSRPPHLRSWRDGWRHLKFLLMFSPLWLYFIPSVVLMLISLFILGAVLTAQRGEVFRLGPIWFGDHAMIMAGGLFIIGYIGILFGLIAFFFSIRESFRMLTERDKKIYNIIRVENAVILGVLFILVGLGIFGYVFIAWSDAGFGGLSRIREMVVSTTFLVVGFVTIFGGFLLSLVGTAESR
jgi:glycosyltransferase involved in cell wall biosynthesis